MGPFFFFFSPPARLPLDCRLTLEQVHKANGSPQILALMQRALRTHPSHTEFWIRYMLALERSSESRDLIHDIKKRAVGCVKQFHYESNPYTCMAWHEIELSWCAYLRRRYLNEDATDVDKATDDAEIRLAITGMYPNFTVIESIVS